MAHIIGTNDNDLGSKALTGTNSDDKIEGLDGRDDLYALNGNDILDGGNGADNMFGGYGDDTYWVDDRGDTVSEGANRGNDTVYTSVIYTLADNVEKLVLTGLGNIAGYGNAGDNTLVGNIGSNRLNGNDGNDMISGGWGNDTLDGGKGSDMLQGGEGNDRYYVDLNDTVSEDHGEGLDTVYSASTFTIGDNIERLTLTGSGDRFGTGNDMDNIINGNVGDNTLGGAGGDDIVNGGLGADTMRGGDGNDVFYVDNAGDTVSEYSNQGNDTVFSSVSFTLGNNVENLTLTGAMDIDATGNGLNNLLTGNDGDNVLDGKAGADVMAGGKGDDTYYVDNAGDVVVELDHGGTDTVFSSVDFDASVIANAFIENVHLTGSGNSDVHGNSEDNVLIGNAGDNFIAGLGGDDMLTGGAGADTFFFGSQDGTYTIADFSAAENDMISYDGDHMSAAVITQVGADVHIQFGEGETIVVLNTMDDATFRSHLDAHG